jgi:hypothetical protein
VAWSSARGGNSFGGAGALQRPEPERRASTAAGDAEDQPASAALRRLCGGCERHGGERSGLRLALQRSEAHVDGRGVLEALRRLLRQAALHDGVELGGQLGLEHR